MTQPHHLPAPNQPTLWVKSVFAGAAITLLAVSFFVFGANEANPDWGRFWIIRPLISTPLAGALGGAFYAFMNYRSTRGLHKTVAVLPGLVGYCIALWLGIVLGLANTM